MESPLGPLEAFAFMLSIEEKFGHENKLPSLFNKRYLDDTTLALLRDRSDASAFLATLL